MNRGNEGFLNAGPFYLLYPPQYIVLMEYTEPEEYTELEGKSAGEEMCHSNMRREPFNHLGKVKAAPL